jgi:hypothetical protein
VSVPFPRGRLHWGISIVIFGLILVVIIVGALSEKPDVEQPVDLCAEERKACEESRVLYEEMRERQKERCDERFAQWKKERETLTEAVKRCPCCEGGCTKELLHKEYLLQSQATYYKKHLKKVCGVKRPPDPDEKELTKFMKEIEEEEEEMF